MEKEVFNITDVFNITGIVLLGLFSIMMILVFVLCFHFFTYYKTEMIYDDNKDRQYYLKQRPVIFTCSYCDCHFETAHAKELYTNKAGKELLSCKCPLCGSTATGKWLRYEDYIELKKEITSGKEGDDAKE